MSVITAPSPPAAAPARRPRRAGALARVPLSPRALRAWAGTTPGRLRMLSLALVAGVALLWAAAFAALIVRQGAVDTVRADAGPAFVAAERLHADLSSADATVAAAFLIRGVEPPASRTAYDASVASAARQLLALAEVGGAPEAQRALAVIQTQFPVYTALVEHARADHREGNVVGAAYLRQASDLLETQILPAADRLAALDGDRIDANTRAATGAWAPALVAAASTVTLTGLLAAQALLFRRTHRILNTRLIAATVLVAVLMIVALVQFAAERSQLVLARDQGFVPMAQAAQARVLGLRAFRDESLSLIARGDGAARDADADAATRRLGFDPVGRATGVGLLPALAGLPGPDGPARERLGPLWRAYQATRLDVDRKRSETGGFEDAFTLATSSGTTAFKAYDTAVYEVFTASEGRFASRVSAASDRLSGLAAVVTVLAALAVALVLHGLQLRINEYR